MLQFCLGQTLDWVDYRWGLAYAHRSNHLWTLSRLFTCLKNVCLRKWNIAVKYWCKHSVVVCFCQKSSNKILHSLLIYFYSKRIIKLWDDSNNTKFWIESKRRSVFYIWIDLNKLSALGQAFSTRWNLFKSIQMFSTSTFELTFVYYTYWCLFPVFLHACNSVCYHLVHNQDCASRYNSKYWMDTSIDVTPQLRTKCYHEKHYMYLVLNSYTHL